MAEFESVVDYSTKLDNFEGPLDLLFEYFPQVQLLFSIPQFGQNIEFDIKNILV